MWFKIKTDNRFKFVKINKIVNKNKENIQNLGIYDR